MTELTEGEKKLARSALGLVSARQSYRNRFFTREDDPEWLSMIGKGFAVCSETDKGRAWFHMTEAGARAALNPGETLCPEDFPHRALSGEA